MGYLIIFGFFIGVSGVMFVFLMCLLVVVVFEGDWVMGELDVFILLLVFILFFGW